MTLNRLRFEIARAKAQMPLTRLSKEAGCNARYFKGTGPIKVTTLAAGRIAIALGVDLETLVDEPPQENTNDRA